MIGERSSAVVSLYWFAEVDGRSPCLLCRWLGYWRGGKEIRKTKSPRSVPQREGRRDLRRSWKYRKNLGSVWFMIGARGPVP